MTSIATLTLGNQTITLPYNPNNVIWNYLLNKQIIDTYGGRVVQILSVSTQQMNFTGDAGSRPKLMYLFSQLKQMQASQIQSQNSATLVIPASFAENGTITQSVYIDTINLGIDYTTVIHPYQIVFQIEDNSATDQLVGSYLKAVSKAFQYSAGVGNTATGNLNLIYQGLDQSNQLSVAQLASSFSSTGENAKTIITTPIVNGSYNP
jgi:hypothetical protein